MASASSSGGKKRGGVLREEFGNPERRTAYLMILPTLLIILAIALFPVIYAFLLSVTSSTITSVGSFVGVQNYVDMFQNPAFREGLWNTVIFTVVAVFFEFIIGLAIALAINRAFRGRGLVRAAVLVPWAFPTVISAVMWRLMFQDQVGVVNWLANDVLGVIAQPILSDRTLLLIAAIGVDVWKTTPFMALLLLAGLLTIPEDVYEAARVDGANVFQRFFSITMPLLKPALLVALLFRTLESYRVFDLFWGMSNRELESLSTFVYKGVKISQLQFAQGNAAAVFIFITAFLLALVFIKGFGMQTSTEDR
ncbi:ABC-type sugar transport systems permease component [Rubrobacter radiotolerans]|uniref:ABC-type sugar transport systems permease component n=1 Tax=Rubrobacter radiotolerans TaxID=42256 RepID=A0A023X4F6_RUBRA|nr:sugar ABC transporter permease [Rubrobacter radiotolerans]AHY47051.1 ABC-type sugar transport systems permease component [Rubrobacter radiotolerans]MDX5894457.1 sugar ABC transporter permease [Rubrobacter radiotolerans]SMC06045.1 multiple sugar transport system permease protein [Rubrobacter radiotolerans DSM 5868]